MDWHRWYEAYGDPDSSLSRRLSVVRRRIGEALDRWHGGPMLVLSLCAGDGRDLLPELVARPSLQSTAVLVELDPELAGRAASSGRTEVRTADAGDPSVFADVLPVDLLLLCGIFGNVSPDDIRRTVMAVPSMLAPGGMVIWTRGRFEGDDLRPVIRRWCTDSGLEEVAFDGDPEPYGVGVARLAGATSTEPLPDRLFTFIR